MSSWLISICNLGIKGIGTVLSTIVALLPSSPFQMSNTWLANINSEWIAYLNWIIPIDAIISTVTAWLAAMLLYYAYMIFFRWVKVIG